MSTVEQNILKRSQLYQISDDEIRWAIRHYIERIHETGMLKLLGSPASFLNKRIVRYTGIGFCINEGNRGYQVRSEARQAK